MLRNFNQDFVVSTFHIPNAIDESLYDNFRMCTRGRRPVVGLGRIRNGTFGGPPPENV